MGIDDRPTDDGPACCQFYASSVVPQQRLRGLVRRGQRYVDQASLATSWEPLEGENGCSSICVKGDISRTAQHSSADVMFSYERASNRSC
jgi:hypothetical protein